MKKRNRLRKNKEIAALVNKKISKSSSSFIIYYNQNDYSFSRVCISVSKKLGNAVIRNKIRRQIREMVKDIFALDKNKDYVIVARKLYNEKDFHQNKEQLESLYQKINN